MLPTRYSPYASRPPLAKRKQSGVTPHARARIVVVDDDTVMAALARQSLESEGYEVLVQQHWEDAHRMVAQFGVDLVVLDLRFDPGEMGWRVVDQLRFDVNTRETSIILWSSAVEVLAARGPALLTEDHVHVLAKPLGLDALSVLVAHVLNGRRTTSTRDPGSLEGAHVDLTPREQEVTRLIARGYSNKQLAEELVVTPGTAANHVAHILSKLALANRTQVAMWAAERGLVDPPRPETSC